MLAAFFRNVVGAPTSYALDWYRRALANGGTVSPSTLSAVDDFVKDCLQAGVWNKIKRCNLFSGDWLAAIVPLVQGSGFATDVPQGLMSPSDYTELGVQGGVKPYPIQNTATPTSKWFDTGWIPSVNLAVGDIHLGFYNNNIADQMGGEFRVPLGASTANPGGSYNADAFDGNPADGYRLTAYLGVGNTWRFQTDLGGGGVRGHLIATLKGGVMDGLLNGVTYGAVNATGAGTHADLPLFVGASSIPSGLSQYATNTTIAGYHIGDGLTHAEAVALSTAMTKYQKALGRWVNPAVADWQRRVRQTTNSVAACTWSSAVLQTLSDFMDGLDAAGITPKLGRLSLFAGTNVIQARIPLIRGIPYNQGSPNGSPDTQNGHADSDWMQGEGWEKTNAGNNIGQTNGVGLSQLTGGLSVWAREVPTMGTLFGWGDAAVPTDAWRIRATVGTIEGQYGQTVAAVAAAPVAGFFQVIRTGPTDLKLYNNGVLAGSNVAATAAVATPTFPMSEAMAVAGTPFDDINNWVHSGGYSYEIAPLTPSEAAAYYAAWLTAMTAFGRVETYGILTEAGDNLMASNGKQLATEQA